MNFGSVFMNLWAYHTDLSDEYFKCCHERMGLSH